MEESLNEKWDEIKISYINFKNERIASREKDVLEDELFLKIHYFLNYIRQSDKLLHLFNYENQKYITFLSNIKYDSRFKIFLSNIKFLFNELKKKDFSKVEKEPILLYTINENNEAGYNASSIPNFLNSLFRVDDDYSFSELGTINNLLSDIFYSDILVNQVDEFLREQNLNAQEEWSFFKYSVNELLLKEQIVNFLYIDKFLSFAGKYDLISEKAEEFLQLGNSPAKVSEQFYKTLEILYKNISKELKEKGSLTYIINKFISYINLYKEESFYEELIKPKAGHTRKDIEAQLKKELNKFLFMNDFLPLAEIELRKGYIDTLLNNPIDQNLFIYEAKQIYFEANAIVVDTDVIRTISDAKGQVDGYCINLKNYPGVSTEAHIVIFTGKNFQITQDTYVVNSFRYHIHIIPILNENLSKAKSSPPIDISAIF